jgi:hypothetical protein
MKLFSFLLSFLVAGAVYALPLEITWDAVTTDTNGDLLSAPPTYRVYRKTSLDDFKPIATTKNRRWTWLVPSIGRAEYYVTAFNENGESGPSNVIAVIVDRVPRQEVPQATIAVPPVPAK